MPNRILKESICTSEELAAISPEAEVLFYRLIVKADDFGLFHGNPKLLASLLFPLTTPPEKKVEAWLMELCAAGLVQLYEVDGKRYLKLVSFSKHQQPRAKNSKFPNPQSIASRCNQLQADASRCKQLLPINDNDNDNGNDIDNVIEVYCTEPSDDSSMPEPEEPPVVTLPLNDKSEFPILQADVDQWEELYPAVDVMQELRNMRGWLDANPAKRKTKAGVRRFINSWLAREQDKGGSAPRGSAKRNKVGEKLDPDRKSEIQEFTNWAFRTIYADAIVDTEGG